MLILVSLLAFASLLLSAESPWAKLREQNPPETEFSMRLLDQRTFRQGELIRAEIVFPDKVSTTDNRSDEIWGWAGVLLDPATGCGTTGQPCTMHHARLMKTDPWPGAHWRDGPTMITLNGYLPALAPGKYHVAFLARKLNLSRRLPNAVTYEIPDPPVFAVSNAIDLEITPATEEWIAQMVGQSATTLKRPRPFTEAEHNSRDRAAEQLSYFDHPVAWRASLDLLPVESGRLLSGLTASEQPELVCRLMHERLPARTQVVSLYYMARMAEICGRAELPVPPDSSAPDEERRKFGEAWRDYNAKLHRRLHARLAASLGQKRSDAKAVALDTLIGRVQQDRLNAPGEPTPEWIDTQRQEFIRSLPKYDSSRQRLLLETVAGTFVWPELTHVLESLIDAWKPGVHYENPRVALRALHAMNPERAHAKIIEELCKPKTWMTVPLLDILPASAVGEMDDALIEALAEAQREGGWLPELRMAALAKYATPDALPRLRAIYESQQNPCQPELMAYFVRVDPEYAQAVFKRQEWDMHSEPPPCTVQYFDRTAALAMHPALEEYMAAFLMHETVLVKKTAARSLARNGSAAALTPLWEAFRYFHDYWQGNGKPDYEGTELEVDLRNAIARGWNWLASEADLRLLESLCTAGRCLSETREDLHTWEGTPRIEISQYAEGVRCSVAQYRGIETVSELKLKLSQFPKGTQFTLRVRGPDAQWAAAEIKRFAGQQGLVLTER